MSWTACTGRGGDAGINSVPGKPTTSGNPTENREDHDLLLEY
jgi:hypothetical protein